MTPSVQFGTLQFGKFEEIQARGYDEALKLLEKWDEEGRLPSSYIEGKEPSLKRKRKAAPVRVFGLSAFF